MCSSDLRFLSCNAKAFGASGGLFLPPALRRIRHGMNRNTRRGSRRNIAAHYDLGNAFYAQWLDPGMMYSSGLYPENHSSLIEAQQAKLDRVAALLELSGGERVLEIGCGWGGLAEMLAERHGCTVTGLTLSSEQLAYARERLKRSPARTRCEFRLQDYRDAAGTYDRIVSIEMLEAVGEAYWHVYFEKLRSCLRPGGTAVLQVITIGVTIVILIALGAATCTDDYGESQERGQGDDAPHARRQPGTDSLRAHLSAR